MRSAATIRHLSIKSEWDLILPILQMPVVQAILHQDMNLFTQGRWGIKFVKGDKPYDYDNHEWYAGDPRVRPGYWDYVHVDAERYLLNTQLLVASIRYPSKAWRILSNYDGGTVFDGVNTIFDINAYALEVPAAEKLKEVRRYGSVLAPGEILKLREAVHWTDLQLEELDRQRDFESGEVKS